MSCGYLGYIRLRDEQAVSRFNPWGGGLSSN